MEAIQVAVLFIMIGYLGYSLWKFLNMMFDFTDGKFDKKNKD